jgi:hypothetical protein
MTESGSDWSLDDAKFRFSHPQPEIHYFITRVAFKIASRVTPTTALEPMPPIAIPTFALANTGASLMPSPTKATLPCLDSKAGRN